MTEIRTPKPPKIFVVASIVPYSLLTALALITSYHMAFLSLVSKSSPTFPLLLKLLGSCILIWAGLSSSILFGWAIVRPQEAREMSRNKRLDNLLQPAIIALIASMVLAVFNRVLDVWLPSVYWVLPAFIIVTISMIIAVIIDPLVKSLTRRGLGVLD